MRKYWAFYKAGLGKMFVYRGPMLLWVLGNILHVVMLVAVWLSVRSYGLIGGYTKNELITYAVISVFMPWIISWNPFSAIKREIKDGSIAGKILLKPVSYYLERLSWELAWHSMSIFIGLAAGLIAVAIFYRFLTVSIISPEFLFSLPALLLGGLIQYNLSFAMALFAFWFSEVEPLSGLKWMALAILGGSSIPIGFIPNSFQILIKILPFRYMFSFPIEIMMGKISGSQIFFGYLTGILWFGLLFVCCKILWSKGLKVYTAVGN